ncbi:MAG: MFS transporter [Clostridia bacterium]|nr:MFS transporter [Clostridia bacterium]
MKIRTKEEKLSALLLVAALTMYVLVCMTKSNYTASIAFFVKEGIFTKAKSGLISACFYLIYSVGQIIGGVISDRISPYKVISIGVLGSALINLALCFTSRFEWVLVLWSLCGIIQFGIWPGLVKIVASVISPKHRKTASVLVGMCIGTGGILSYLVATPMLEWLGWTGLFGMNTAILALVLVMWASVEKLTAGTLMPHPISRLKKAAAAGDKPAFFPIFLRSGLPIIMVINMIINMLSIGIKSWVPTMMMESYDISATWASVQTAVTYAVNIAGAFAVIYLFRKIKNELLCESAYLFICIPFYVVLLFIGRGPMWSMLTSVMVTTTFTYAVGNLNVRTSATYEKYGCSATVSGILNGMASFGIFAANASFGIIAQNHGWSAVTVILVCIGSLGALLSLVVGATLWRRFKLEKASE